MFWIRCGATNERFFLNNMTLKFSYFETLMRRKKKSPKTDSLSLFAQNQETKKFNL